VFLSCTSPARHVDWSVRIAGFKAVQGVQSSRQAAHVLDTRRSKWVSAMKRMPARMAVDVDRIHSCDPRDATALIDARFGEQFSRLVKYFSTKIHGWYGCRWQFIAFYNSGHGRGLQFWNDERDNLANM
jgi:hypothetical protein